MLLERLEISADGQPVMLPGENQQALLEQARISSTNCLLLLKYQEQSAMQAELQFEGAGGIWPQTASFGKLNVSNLWQDSQISPDSIANRLPT